MNETINISVLGHSGVGKTSTLIAMLDHFRNDLFENLNLRFGIDHETGKMISEEKSRLLSSLDKGTVEHTQGIKPTSKLTTYQVNVNGKGKALAEPLSIEFVDYPGSWLSKGSAEWGTVREKLSVSKVLIIPVDSALSMETGDTVHAENILAILKDLYQDLNDPRLVILAPVKSEKYFEGEDGSSGSKPYNTLMKHVQEEYEHVLTFLTSRPMKKNVSVIITPIQTLGSCKLMYFSGEHQQKVPVFVVTQRGVYAPKHAEQPLIYLLSFLLKDQYEIQRKGLGGFVRKLNGTLNNLAAYSEELSQTYSGYSQSTKIIQNSTITNF